MASALERLSVSRSTFFNHAWIYSGIAIVLLGMVLRERAVTLLGIVPLVTAGGSWLWARYSLTNVEYFRELSEQRVFAGDKVKLHIKVTNRKLLPLASLEIEDSIADRLRVLEREIVPSGTTGVAVLRITTAMRWFERVTWNLTIECPARGYFPVGPVDLRSSDAFGFFQQRERIPGVDHITVFPAIADLDRIIVPARHLFGEQKIQRPIITDPMRTIGIRDYRPEDSFRHIHWKATARAQSLQTKIFEPTTSIQFGIFLNLDTFERYWEGLDFDRAEGAIVTAATIAAQAVEADHMVGMYANGVVGGSDQALRVRPSRDDRQLEQILTGLAKLSPIASLDYAAIVRAETSRFPIGSTVVLVTAIMTERLRAVLDGLLRANHRVVIVTIGEVDIPRHPRIEIFPVDLRGLEAYIPEHHHYAVRMSNMPIPPLDPISEPADVH
ncbi:MAG: DUF58 domain-containing protein [Thermomicrobiales bacterium]